MKPDALCQHQHRHGGLRSQHVRACATGILALALLGLGPAMRAQEQSPGAAAALQARRIALEPQLRANAFGQPLQLSSNQGSAHVEGDVHAEVDAPFPYLAATLTSATGICELLLLHLNVRACWPANAAGSQVLMLTVGPKRASASGTRYRLDYAMRVEVATPDYLRVTLDAARGPLGTRDYRILLEAIPLEGGRAFVHLGYRYGHGLLARIAMGAYLATAGRSKIGFTVLGQDADGRPRYVRGERAALERNVMRYFLALLAHSSGGTGTPQQQMEARLRAWFALTERYPAQLHELDLDDYLQEKHDDLAGQPSHAP